MFIHTVNETFNPTEHFDNVAMYQGLFFRQWQQRCGRNILALAADDAEGKTRAFAQCIEYVLPVIGSIWTATLGPIGSFNAESDEKAFYKELQALCTETSPKTVAVRVQTESKHAHTPMIPAERHAGSFVQPFVEEIVSLEEDIEDIISRFSKNTRRMVQRYIREEDKEIRFHIEKKEFKKHFNEAYALLKDLAHTKRFQLHPKTYYETLFETLEEYPENGTLILGYVAGETALASFVVVIHTGTETYHLCSASSETGYEHAVPTLAHYIAIKDAKDRGTRQYNLGGVISTSAKSAGDLSTFKKKFGGESIQHPPSADIVVSVWRYGIFRFLRLPPVMMLRRLVMRAYRKVVVELNQEA